MVTIFPHRPPYSLCIFFFFNDTATTEIYTLSLHDALPISIAQLQGLGVGAAFGSAPEIAQASQQEPSQRFAPGRPEELQARSEEHTSELQSLAYLVCRLLLEKKKKDSVYILPMASRLLRCR